jgi:phosphoribosylglycinamide formyltransferase-1
VKRIVVLISGRGSNMEALLDAELSANVAAVISNVAVAQGLATARARGVTTRVVDHSAYAERTAFEEALSAELDRFAPDLIALAGFMRVLSESFVRRYSGRLLNIHPSLLPAFPGLHTHKRALEAGVRIHGCTVHFVTPDLDSGPIVAQAAVAVAADDTEERLAARVLREEHLIYPQAVRWYCEERLALGSDGVVRVEGASAGGHPLFCPSLEHAR